MKLHFSYGGEILIVKIDGTNVTFATTETGLEYYYPIDNLGFTEEKMIEEFPDLKGKPIGEIRLTVNQRIKEHIKNLGSEEQVKEYIIKEFTNNGYTLELIRRAGFRDHKPK